MSELSSPADPVAAQYEAYPYPARDPADEARRLVMGSPSHPVEIDHFLFKGRRDWTAPFRALVAGGGTGDATIMLAQMLADRGTPAEIHYLDLSAASRAVAEARAAARGLTTITFHTGDLNEAAGLGPFDYIDCCGVLHHLPDPQAGLGALATAVSPEGGLGLMVYAPHGRAGVYEMQALLRALCGDRPPVERVPIAKAVLAALPPTNPLARNPFVSDHIEGGDAGIYDLLLHDRDVAYEIDAFLGMLDAAGLRLAGFAEPARYDPATYASDPSVLSAMARWSIAERAVFAERLAGNLKTHVLYAAPAARGETVAKPHPDATPTLHLLEPKALAASLAKTGRLKLSVDGLKRELPLDRGLAPLAARLDGRATLGALQAGSGLDWMAFQAAFATLYKPLDGVNALRFSGFRR